MTETRKQLFRKANHCFTLLQFCEDRIQYIKLRIATLEKTEDIFYSLPDFRKRLDLSYKVKNRLENYFNNTLKQLN